MINLNVIFEENVKKDDRQIWYEFRSSAGCYNNMFPGKYHGMIERK
jgi:hypothetical protein